MISKILILGKKGFVASNLFNYLKKEKAYVANIDFKHFFFKKKNYLEKFDYIINCSTNKKFILRKYSKKNDLNFKIAKKIIGLSKVNFIMLSSRKVYKAKFNITEAGTLLPSCQYSKNILRSEIEVKKFLHKQRLLILRISNLIGYNKPSSKKILKTFVYNFYDNIKKGYMIKISHVFKDFLGIDKFSEIVLKLIQKKCYGTYNVSLGKKIFIKKIVSWLNFYNKSSYQVVEFKESHNNDCFTLCNKKLMKTISVKNRQIDLKKECLTLSRKFFRGKK